MLKAGWFSSDNAAKILLAGIILAIILHGGVLFGIVPASSLWGGRAGSLPIEPDSLEVLAISVLTLFFLMIFGCLRLSDSHALRRWCVMGTRFIAFFFMLNTLGNLLSASMFERWALAPVTAGLTFLSWRAAR